MDGHCFWLFRRAVRPVHLKTWAGTKLYLIKRFPGVVWLIDSLPAVDGVAHYVDHFSHRSLNSWLAMAWAAHSQYRTGVQGWAKDTEKMGKEQHWGTYSPSLGYWSLPLYTVIRKGRLVMPEPTRRVHPGSSHTPRRAGLATTAASTPGVNPLTFSSLPPRGLGRSVDPWG